MFVNIIISIKFQLTAARRRLVSGTNSAWLSCDFNSQPREGGWRFRYAAQKPWPIFQLTAARRRLAGWRFGGCVQNKISTHSRAKAAGFRRPPAWRSRNDFNSQPREGGWDSMLPPDNSTTEISTHSRAKAAGLSREDKEFYMRHFNSQPREGGWENTQTKEI